MKKNGLPGSDKDKKSHENLLQDFGFDLPISEVWDCLSAGTDNNTAGYLYESLLKDAEKQKNAATKAQPYPLQISEGAQPLLARTAAPPPAEKSQRTIDEEKLKEYLIPNIFTKKGRQKCKADELIKILQSDRTQIEIAVIAKFIKNNHLLKEKYKYSLDWSKWLPLFYEISGLENGYLYRQTEINDALLEGQLQGLFPKTKNNK